MFYVIWKTLLIRWSLLKSVTTLLSIGEFIQENGLMYLNFISWLNSLESEGQEYNIID